MLEKLGSALRSVVDKIARRGGISRESLDEIAKDIQRALLQSDVNVKLVFQLTEEIKNRALKEKPKAGMTEKEHVVNIVYEELVKFLGSEPKPLKTEKTKILLCGLFGSGKTTTSAKIAKYYQKKGLKSCLIACDTYRPAAYEQLEQLGKQIGVTVFGNPKEKNSSKILKDSLDKAKKFDIVIVDSSGRDALDKEMIKEIESLNKILQPDEKLMVIPADLGQQAEKQASAFRDSIGITGVIVTKMDGTAKGGGALSACAAAGTNVRLIGVGEKIDQLEDYDPKRFVSRLIGFGDIQGLLQKAKEIGINEERAKEIVSGKYTMNEFYEQMGQMKQMGSLSQIADMIPGLGKLVGTKIKKEELESQQKKMERFKFIIDSMTPKEKEDPDLIDSGRVSRIAKGSGTSEAEVKELIKMFNQSKKMMKMMSGKGNKQMRNLMKQFGMG